eukprot:10380480-Alexandrium_andersonii.AAC.1
MRKPDPDKAKALREWPDPKGLDDVVSFRAFVNFVKEFIPSFQELDRFLRPHTKKGARFEEYLKDQAA